MEFRYTVEVGTQGLPFVPKDPNADLHIRAEDDQVIIVGNQAGLLDLARQLISLALVPDQPRGYHIHLGPGDRLDAESTPVTFYHDVDFRNQ